MSRIVIVILIYLRHKPTDLKIAILSPECGTLNVPCMALFCVQNTVQNTSFLHTTNTSVEKSTVLAIFTGKWQDFGQKFEERNIQETQIPSFTFRVRRSTGAFTVPSGRMTNG
jgi:hypothetical protein